MTSVAGQFSRCLSVFALLVGFAGGEARANFTRFQLLTESPGSISLTLNTTDTATRRQTTVNNGLTLTSNFDFSITGKNYGSGTLNDLVSLNSDGTVSKDAISGAGGSAPTTVTETPTEQAVQYAEGTTIQRNFSTYDQCDRQRRTLTRTASPGVSWNNLSCDGANRLTWEQVLVPGQMETTGYASDAPNNRTNRTKTEIDGEMTAAYSYDADSRLTGYIEGAKTEFYGYDANGSRTSWSNNGAQTAACGYDPEHRLINLSQERHAYGYTYDYRTQRVARVEDGASTQVIFSGVTSVQEIGGNLTTVEYVRGSDWGGGMGSILYSLRGGSPSFTRYDSRGDVTAKTDGAGNVTYQASYKALGTRTQEQGATLDRQKANTKEEEPSGLPDEGMRYRVLETGTFITADPAGFVDGPSLYAYVRQNPWSAFDPLGLESDDERKSDFDIYKRLQKTFEDAAHQAEHEAKKHGVPERVSEAYRSASESAKKIAVDMQHRAEILAHANENNYREQVRSAYGVNNPDFNSISAFYADKFNDQDTLNFLGMQHPATPPSLDANSIVLMALFPEAAFGESPIAAEAAGPNYSAVEFVNESPLAMSEEADFYQSKAPGSKWGFAPRLTATAGGETMTAKFDGVDASTGEMVDRKLGVGGSAYNLALRQSATARANGFGVRWEVPTASVQKSAQRIISKLGVDNIRVVVAPR